MKALMNTICSLFVLVLALWSLFYSFYTLMPSIRSSLTFESQIFHIKSNRPAECMALAVGNCFGRSTIIGFWFQAIEFLSATQEIERSIWFNLTFRDLLVSIVAFLYVLSLSLSPPFFSHLWLKIFNFFQALLDYRIKKLTLWNIFHAGLLCRVGPDHYFHISKKG